MSTILEATLKSGEVVHSEFDRLTKVGKYATDVFTGKKPFNAWRILERVHPHSGEKCLIRERLMINGTEIRSLRQVKMGPAGNYEPVPTVQSGERGVWTAPSNPDDAVVDAVMGEQYPVHRDMTDLRDYVILRAGNEEGQDEVRYYLDGEGDAGVRSQTGSSWDDDSPIDSDDDDDTDALR